MHGMHSMHSMHSMHGMHGMHDMHSMHSMHGMQEMHSMQVLVCNWQLYDGPYVGDPLLCVMHACMDIMVVQK
jgi:hypothetical protein